MSTIKQKLTALNNAVLLTPKLMYFTMNLVVYSFHLYRGPFIVDYLGLGQGYVGLSGTLMGLASFPCITMWSSIADRLGRHKLVLSTITVASVTCFVLLFLRFENMTLRFFYTTVMLMMYSAFLAGMQPLLDYEALELLSSKPGFSKEIYGRQRLWGTVAYSCITLGGAYLMKIFDGFEVLAVIMPAVACVFLVTLYFTALPDRPKPFRRAGKRTASAAESVQVAAKAVDTEEVPTALPAVSAEKPPQPAVSVDSVKNAAASEALDAAAMEKQAQFQLTESTDALINVVSTHAAPIRSPWKVLLTNPNYMFFLLVVLMLGLARATMTLYLAVFWSTSMKLSQMQIAYAGAIFGMALEIVVFFVAKYIAPVLGNYWMLLIAQMAMAGRCWAYYLIPTEPGLVYLVYAVELLKGMSFGMAHSAAIKIANECAPPGLEATSQALYNSVYVQLPTVMAGLAGLWGFGKLGPAAAKTMFLATACISTAALVLFGVKYSIEGKLRFKR